MQIPLSAGPALGSKKIYRCPSTPTLIYGWFRMAGICGKGADFIKGILEFLGGKWGGDK